MERTIIDGKEVALAGLPCLHEVTSVWIEEQDSLKKKLVAEDDYTWNIPTTNYKLAGNGEGEHVEENCEVLKYVGGVDISFCKDDPSIACGMLVILDLLSLEVVYEDYSRVKLTVPYVPGFLAFREAPILLELVKKMKDESNPFFPQLLMVDGNGLLHPRGGRFYTESCFLGFGLACHLGVLVDLPTIGIGKNLHHVDGLTNSRVRDTLKSKENCDKDFIPLIGDSGHTLGVAMQSTQGSLKPIFVSVGHRISLASAIKIVKMTSKYRIPEPVRQADLRSRGYLRKHQ